MKAWKLWLTTICINIVLTTQIVAIAIPAAFNNSVIINDSDFTDLTNVFAGRSRPSSIALIQKFLDESGSALAKRSNNKSTHINDAGKDFSQVYLDVPTDWGTPDGKWLQERPWLQQYVGQTVSFAEAIWMLSQENLGKSKYINENQFYFVNPIYLLSLVQKESGLVYGTYSREPYGNQSLNYRFNRMTGYACRDGQPDCDIEFLGAFRQMYFGLRDTKAYSDGCKLGFNVWNNGVIGNSPPFNQGFKVGNEVTIDGGRIKLNTAIACTSYIYTPHDTYINFFNIMTAINQKFIDLAPGVPLDGGSVSSASSSISASSSSSTQPSDTFSGIELKQGSQPDVIKQIEAPKPPPPPPPYVPLYVEEEGLSKYPDPLLDEILISTKTPRSVVSESSSVSGVQTVKQSWYTSPIFVVPIVFLTIQSILLGVYYVIKKFF